MYLLSFLYKPTEFSLPISIKVSFFKTFIWEKAEMLNKQIKSKSIFFMYLVFNFSITMIESKTIPSFIKLICKNNIFILQYKKWYKKAVVNYMKVTTRTIGRLLCIVISVLIIIYKHNFGNENYFNLLFINKYQFNHNFVMLNTQFLIYL